MLKMNDFNSPHFMSNGYDWIDLVEEEIECSLGDWFSEFNCSSKNKSERINYFINLLKLQRELIKLQTWISNSGHRLVVLFEGRDAAGKGGVIKRITQRLNPRICRVAALPIPSEREKTQWYFQRYIAHLPAAGEIVLFDRSWYNRAGVEKVMGYCSQEEYEEFLTSAPEFEKMIIRSGIQIIKYWFSVTDEEQHSRFVQRMTNPLKQWKLSPIDIASRAHWKDYTHAKEVMFQRTHTPESPWWIVSSIDKQRARLNCISHLLDQVRYQEITPDPIHLPESISFCTERSQNFQSMHIPERF
jgi:polyphosphate kinase 2